MGQNQNEEKQGEQQKKKDKGISRRKFIAGAGIAGAAALLAFLFRDRISDLLTPPEEGVPPPEKPPPEEGPPGEAPGTLEAPEMPENMPRPYLTIKPLGLTHGSGGDPDVLDLFLTNNGDGSSTAFFDVYRWIAPKGQGTITPVATWFGRKNVVLANGGFADVFPLHFPSERCIFVSREIITLPPGAAVARKVYIDYDWDGIWGLFGDPILDPCKFTIESQEFLATEECIRKHIYCGV